MQTYIVTNTISGKFYIGSTNDFVRRKKEHLSGILNYPFQNALRKNPEAFEWEVWEDSYDEPVLEQALLDMWFGKECCYNLNPVAERPPSWEGKRHSSETLLKMSISAKQSWADNLDRKKLAAAAAANREWEQNSKDKIGNANSLKWGNAWEVIGPDGNIHTITNLRRFCREHNLNRSCMMNLVKNQKGQKTHRGFRLASFQ